MTKASLPPVKLSASSWKDLASRVPLSIPAPGRTIFGCAEERARWVRGAVALLKPELDGAISLERFRAFYDSRFSSFPCNASADERSERTAKNLVNQWLLGRLSGALDRSATFRDAESWFLGSFAKAMGSLIETLPVEAERAALKSLSQISIDEDFLDLMPYVLEPYGPGSRLTAMKDPTTAVAWEAKRDAGVFYTPSDVAEYMVSRLYEKGEGHHTGAFIDPCCGSGVFLIANLRLAQRRAGSAFDPLKYISENLFGMDISEAAVEACIFALQAHVTTAASSRSLSPWAVWHLIRLNVCPGDALRLVREVSPSDSEALRRQNEIKESLCTADPRSVSPVVRESESLGGDLFSASPSAGRRLGEFFPAFAAGFGCMAANPPYAEIGQRNDFDDLCSRFDSLPVAAATANLYPLFIELMWKLLRDERGASAIVVPLSIAYHQGKQYSACRRSIARHGGHVDFAFFDREPHALFGEDVKTRNSIIFRFSESEERHAAAKIYTGPLQRWTSRTRATLFSEAAHFPLGQAEISQFVPKLGSEEEAAAYREIQGTRLVPHQPLWSGTSRALLRDTVGLNESGTNLFVASTAYNFLNVFRAIDYTGDTSLLSVNPVFKLRFKNERTRNLGYAVLSSRLAYWLWHVECDGFHVGLSFLERIPVWSDSPEHRLSADLADVGERLWQAVKREPVRSVNSGKVTLAYPATRFASELDVVDSTLIHHLGISPSFLSTLRAFVRKMVVVDDQDERRAKQKKRVDADNFQQQGAMV